MGMAEGAPAPKAPTAKEVEEARKGRLKTISGLLETVVKEFGAGSMMVLGDTTVVGGNAIPTSSIALDMALGVGGIPRGKLIEIYGPESSGKSTLTYAIIAQCQKHGGICALIDAENSLDTEYATAVGVNVDELMVNQPDYGEQGLDIASRLCNSNAVSLIVVDSLAALIPKAEIEAESFEDQQPGLQARMMSKALRRLSGEAAKSGTTIIFINQLREKIGVMFGSPETTPGGKAMKFYAAIRLDIRKIEPIKNGTDIIGNKVRVKTVKNKVAPPFREAVFTIIFGKGIDREAGILEGAVTLDLVEKAGSWYAYQGQRVAQGTDKATAWLRENVSVCDQLEAKIKDSYAQLREKAKVAAETKAKAPAEKAAAPAPAEAEKKDDKK
jgi:recombination protein RecA